MAPPKAVIPTEGPISELWITGQTLRIKHPGDLSFSTSKAPHPYPTVPNKYTIPSIDNSHKPL